MSYSSEAAEQLVHTYMELYLEGTKVALNISGKATKSVISALYSLSKEQKKTKGQIRLSNMIKSGKELTIFPVANEDLKRFTQEAKRYGVLYSTVIDKNKTNSDGMVDIMVRKEDASKLDRIVRRFNIKVISSAEIKTEIQKTREENGKLPIDKGVQEKAIQDIIKDEKQKAPIRSEVQQSSPSITRTVKENQLESSLDNKKSLEGQTAKDKKPSVREELKEIKEDLENKAKEKAVSKETKVIDNKHKNKKKLKKTKERA